MTHDEAKALELRVKVLEARKACLCLFAHVPEEIARDVMDKVDAALTGYLAALDAAEQRVWEKVRQYQQMRITLSDQSRCVEVLAGNIVKEALENGAIAELRGLETWINEQKGQVGVDAKG